MTNNKKDSLPKTLGMRDLVLFTVSAIVLLETLGSAASMGPSAIFFWVFFGITFLVPIALITAEVGTALPEEGGIYVWIRRVFGNRWAARAVWAYWVNTAIWLPSLYVMLNAFVARLFNIELSIGQQITIGLTLCWLTVLLDVIGLKIGKWVPNVGAILKMVLFTILIFGGLQYGMNHELANEFTLEQMKPSWDEGLKYLPVVMYGMLGFELVSGAGGEIRNPQRNIPRAVFLSAFCVLFMYILATAGILVVIPAGEVDIVEGLIDTLTLFLADIPGGETIVMALGLAAIFTFFSNGATWTMGCNRTAGQAGKEGELPSLFGWTHPKHGGPVGAAVAMGIVCSTALLLYGQVAESSADLFWSLMSFSAVIFMLPYIGLALAFLKMRRVETHLKRPFKIPGGQPVAYLLTFITITILTLTAFLFSYVPGEGPQWSVIIGVVVALAIGEVVILISEAEKRIKRARLQQNLDVVAEK
ncbi:APC family permease [Microbulbifer marinus]|uniref:Amino acid/polyamine/organocation transporter, APC superfamily n=1 Tax=Microbulbifer marinus TaxID=658218 RepID=A0A1H3W155_9GAMM|nr:APC family permease [Microbulbifer marinus]SDZ80769.1 amino acid/polyamine/organocation transporter, APC superfamily [Microbulbifer marinus]